MPTWRALLYPLAGRLLCAAGALSWTRSRLGKHAHAYVNAYLDTRRRFEVKLYLREVGAHVYCDVRDWLVRPYVTGSASIYEWSQIQHALRHCRPGDVVVDVGANQGYWSVALGMAAGPAGRVIAVEPNPELAPRLRRTSVINRRLMTLDVAAVALNDREASTVRFYLPTETNSGTGSTVLHEYAVAHGYLEHERSTEVECTTLDSLARSFSMQRLDLLKVDVEFGEDALMRGARKTLARYKPRLVICETSPRSAAYTQLLEMGYSPYVVDEQGRADAVPAGYWGNIFFHYRACA